MLSNRRESLERSDSGVGEPLDPSQEVVKTCQENDPIACVPDGARKLRVLVVDDNRDAADSLSKLLNLWGGDARAAYDGAEALEMTLVQQPDVVLLDLSMPKMDGCDVARRLRRQTAFSDTLLIAITGCTDPAHRRLCDEAGFDHYLLKPIDPTGLRLLLQRERRWLVRSAEESEQKRVNRRKQPAGLRMSFAKKFPLWEIGNRVCSRSHAANDTNDNGGSTMLVLTRKSQETVVVGGADGFESILRVTVLRIKGGSVALGFEVAADVPVHRLEVWERIRNSSGQQDDNERKRVNP